MPSHQIRRALIAVYDKSGITEFARALVDEFGIEIISTGGTAKHLKDAGIPVTLVETITGFPELLDGRVKTLHPKIHAGILADRDNPEHMRQLAEHGIKPIDMVVVNLYPFEKTVADPACKFEDAIEMIDIGGPCMLRAAAKNHKHVLVVDQPDFYEVDLHKLRDAYCINGDPARIRDLYESGAFGAFWRTAGYDARVSKWLSEKQMSGESVVRTLRLWNMDSLRYGENPHQKADYYHIEDDPKMGRLLADEESISFNNYADADAALGLCAELARTPPNLWHRFLTGEVCDRFSTGRGRKSDIRGEHITWRNLPHLQKPGSTYFVTFRTRHSQLTEAERDIVLSASQYWHGEKLTLHCAVIMPDHVHLLLTPHETEKGQWANLSDLLHSIKRHSASEINKQRDTQGPLWLDESFDRLVRNEKEFIEKWEYMEANPVTADIAKPGEYKWFWRSQTRFQETIQIPVTEDTDRLKTCPTEHRLKTGATEPSHSTEQAGTTEQADAANPLNADDSEKQFSTACFIKHTNACGVGVANDPVEAYRRAYLGDPNAAMGGILAVNFPVTADFATMVMETYDRLGKPLREAGAAHAPGGFFVEVWIAPSFDDAAIEIIRGTAEARAGTPEPPKKKWGENVRLLSVGDMTQPPAKDEMVYRSIDGGMLVQTADNVGLNEDDWKVVTKRSPTDSEISDLRLAWLIAKHTKSNAISLCKDGMLIGNGAGQMSRVMSCRIATWLARENGHADKLAGSAAASDAFFPFADGPNILIDAGVTAIIQPGGSKRDEEVIRACDERGVAMIFTGTRHFKH